MLAFISQHDSIIFLPQILEALNKMDIFSIIHLFLSRNNVIQNNNPFAVHT